LKTGNVLGEAVANQFTVGIVFCFEVSSGHAVGSIFLATVGF
jgi:hypothetical protein